MLSVVADIKVSSALFDQGTDQQEARSPPRPLFQSPSRAPVAFRCRFGVLWCGPPNQPFRLSRCSVANRRSSCALATNLAS